MRDGVCAEVDESACVLMHGRSEGAVLSCFHRDIVTGTEALYWGADSDAWGWSNGFEPETLPEVCRCNGEFALD